MADEDTKKEEEFFTVKEDEKKVRIRMALIKRGHSSEDANTIAVLMVRRGKLRNGIAEIDENIKRWENEINKLRGAKKSTLTHEDRIKDLKDKKK